MTVGKARLYNYNRQSRFTSSEGIAPDQAHNSMMTDRITQTSLQKFS